MSPWPLPGSVNVGKPDPSQACFLGWKMGIVHPPSWVLSHPPRPRTSPGAGLSPGGQIMLGCGTVPGSVEARQQPWTVAPGLPGPGTFPAPACPGQPCPILLWNLPRCRERNVPVFAQPLPEQETYPLPGWGAGSRASGCGFWWCWTHPSPGGVLPSKLTTRGWHRAVRRWDAGTRRPLSLTLQP